MLGLLGSAWKYSRTCLMANCGSFPLFDWVDYSVLLCILHRFGTLVARARLPTSAVPQSPLILVSRAGRARWMQLLAAARRCFWGWLMGLRSGRLLSVRTWALRVLVRASIMSWILKMLLLRLPILPLQLLSNRNKLGRYGGYERGEFVWDRWCIVSFTEVGSASHEWSQRSRLQSKLVGCDKFAGCIFTLKGRLLCYFGDSWRSVDAEKKSARSLLAGTTQVHTRIQAKPTREVEHCVYFEGERAVFVSDM